MPVEIDYTNTGWEDVNLESKLHELSELCHSDEILDYYELTGGNINKVIRLDTSSGSSIVAKISPLWYNNSLAREAWCLKKVKDMTDVKVPEVISYTPSDNPIFPNHEILMMEYISGRQLHPDEFLREDVQKRLGEIMIKVHSIPMEGYGWLNQDFSGMYNSWLDFLYNIDNIDLSVKKGAVKEEDRNWFMERMSEEINPNFEPKLIHSDFRKEHIIVKDSQLYTIDWQNCFSADPNYDVGIFLYRNTNLINSLHHYTGKQIDEKTMKDILLYTMRYNLTIIGSEVSGGSPEKLRNSMKKFEELKGIYLNLD